MNKKTFIKLMKELVLLSDDLDNLNEAFKKFEPDFNHVCFSRYEDLALKAISEAMNDKYDWISYWLYDLSRGKEAKRLMVTDINGKDIPMKTLSNLYDCIIDSK